jgi:hypothetical protein
MQVMQWKEMQNEETKFCEVGGEDCEAGSLMLVEGFRGISFLPY